MMNKREKITKSRESNFDLLRIVCTLAVIMGHVSGTYKAAITTPLIFGRLYTEHIPAITFYDVFPCFCVPCFMMLSGAFLLSNDKNINFKDFYKKSFHSIGIPTIVFSIFYFVYIEIITILGIVVKGKNLSLIKPLICFFKGEPFYHMWYMYTLIVVYLFIPVLMLVKREIGEENFAKVSWIFMLISCISGWTSNFELSWSISKGICYIGYVLIGYQIRRFYLNKKNNTYAVLYMLIGVFFEGIVMVIQYYHSLRGISEEAEIHTLVGSFNPLICIGSIFIFSGFSMLELHTEKFKKLAGTTFYIYLIHAAIWDALSRIVRKIDGKGIDCIIIIPSCIIIISILSYVSAILYMKLLKLWSHRSDNKFKEIANVH